MTDREVDVLAIGAGPANLALAAAMEESSSPDLAQNTLIVEQYQDIKWQRGLLLPWARSQVSFLKDLATLRNPRSKFSFLNFMYSQGQLDEFVNMATFYPFRTELSDYLQWVADSLDQVQVRYGARCDGLEPRCDTDGSVSGWVVTLGDGTRIGCRDVVIGAGRDAYVPAVFDDLPEERRIHSSRYEHDIRQWPRDRELRVVVIGGAQSAAEMFRAVHDDLPLSLPTIVLRSMAFQNYQTSKFVNELFFPSFVDEFFNAAAGTRRQLLEEMHLSNYGGLAPPFVEELYTMMYQQRRNGGTRSKVLAMTEVLAARMDGTEVVLDLRDRLTDRVVPLRCDLVLLGTGYRKELPRLAHGLLTQIGITHPEVNRNYRVDIGGRATGGCYLQGVNEETHGMSDSLISVLAHRSQHIVDDMIARRVDRRAPVPATARIG